MFLDECAAERKMFLGEYTAERKMFGMAIGVLTIRFWDKKTPALLDKRFFSIDIRFLDGGFDVPNKCPHTDFLVAQVEFLHGLQQRLHLRIFHHRDDARVHLRPCVRAAAGLTPVRAAPLHLLEESEAAYVQHIQHIFHALGIRLIEYDHDRLHKQ